MECEELSLHGGSRIKWHFFSRLYRKMVQFDRLLGVGENFEAHVGAAWNRMHCFHIYVKRSE